MNNFEEWIGKSQSVTDVLEPARSNALSVALGGQGGLAAGDPLPLLHHWLYFWDVRPPQGMGEDGHPQKGGFLPPVPLPRRMWAGGRLQFHVPLQLGATVIRTSSIVSIKQKSGKSGDLVFVTVRHDLEADGTLAISEEQDLVYRDAAKSTVYMPDGAGAPAGPVVGMFEPDEVVLFRYSALTMNSHRIHYDRPYASNVERYPALVVHGPLQATLLVEAGMRELGSRISSFEFRGQRPAYSDLPVYIFAEKGPDEIKLWTQQGSGQCMTAIAVLSGEANAPS